MTIKQGNWARRLQTGAVLLLSLTIMGFAPGALAVAATIGSSPAVSAVAPGMARIWIYRDYEPYQTLARPYVRLNGAIVGISEPGGASYRDVSPGTYLISVDSDGTDLDQFVTVGVGAGQQVFIKVLTDANWDSGGGGGNRGGGGWRRDTFYTWQVQPGVAAVEIARMPLYDGG